MMDIILKIERHSVLEMQIGYLEKIEKVLSCSISLLSAGLRRNRWFPIQIHVKAYAWEL